MAPYIGFAKNIAQTCRGAAKIFFWSRTSRGGPRVGILKMFRGVQSNFFNSKGGGTIFQAKRGDQSRTTMAKGGIIAPFGHV